MLENATRICGANFGIDAFEEGGTFSTAALHNVPDAYIDEAADLDISSSSKWPLQCRKDP